MTKLSATIAAATAALFMVGGAMAATPQAEAGNEPYESEMVPTGSTVTRGAVEAQAAEQRPAAGQADAVPDAADPQSTLTRQAVETEAAAQEPAAGQGPFEAEEYAGRVNSRPVGRGGTPGPPRVTTWRPFWCRYLQPWRRSIVAIYAKLVFRNGGTELLHGGS